MDGARRRQRVEQAAAGIARGPGTFLCAALCRRGVTIEKTTQRLTLRGSTVDHARVAGLDVGGSEVQLRDVAVQDCSTGVRVERGADGVAATGLRLSGVAAALG